MKEKIGMQKLIELLNEYDKIKGDKEEPIYNWKIAIKTKIYQTYIISARYGFIKWLVENDKINRWRVENNQDYAEYLGNLPLEEYGTEVLLMLLSIADEPIDYLCNLLFKFE